MRPGKRPESQVAVVAHKIARLTYAVAQPAKDAEMDRRLDELFAATASLTQLPAREAADIHLKLDVLCRRLREFLDPEDRGAVLTHLLAESIREDLVLCRKPHQQRNTEILTGPALNERGR
jgi:hypothetical protein